MGAGLINRERGEFIHNSEATYLVKKGSKPILMLARL